MVMQLWLLRPREDVVHLDDEDANPWEPWYDACFGLVVRAATEERARQVASTGNGAERVEAWLDARYSTCEVLSAKGAEGVIIEDVHWA